LDKVVITGGAGFIGSHLATHFVASGFEVVVIDNFATGHRRNLAHVEGDVRLVEGDVRDSSLLSRLIPGARWVLHHAAMVSVPLSVERPSECHEVNATGTLNVLDAAARAGCEALTFAASAAAYGDEPTLPKVETMAPLPLSPYASTKLYGEHCCSVWTRQFGLPCVPLRYFNIFGERQDPAGAYAAVISRFVERMSEGKAPIVFGDGGQTRDFCHVSDVVGANHAALERAGGAAGTPINIGTGRRTSLLELVESLNQVLGTDLTPEFRPERAGDIRHSVADIARAGELLDYEPRTSLVDGLGRLVASVGGGLS
jgi:UDP-glucose 4-epimerase